MKLRIYRTTDSVDVLLLPHKDGRGWSFVNLTKGHICPCVFKSCREALADLRRQESVKSWVKIEGA